MRTGWIYGSTIGTSAVPNERADLYALLGNQQGHDGIVSLTHLQLQVVELQRAVAAQKLATERHAAAAVQAEIVEKVAGKFKTITPSNRPSQPGQTGQPEKKNDGGGDGPVAIRFSIWSFSRHVEEAKAC